MHISRRAWATYVNGLRMVDGRAAEEMMEAINRFGMQDNDMLVKIGYAIAHKYGNAASAWACEFYDSIAQASNVRVPDAECPEEIITFSEAAKTVNGTLKTGNPEIVSNSVRTLVKRAGADTILSNAIRDGAEFAWIPNGDTCAFCIMLASRGWQKASKEALQGGHAEHIHAHCDCEYAIRFNDSTTVEGYNPQKYLEMYEDAEGDTWEDKVNSMRRDHYQQNKEKINAQKRIAYAARKARDEGESDTTDQD